MQYQIDENPEKLIIPLEISKVIYEDYNADLVILDQPDQVYGKALHGKGKINFKNGNVYEGEIQNGMMHGKGKFTWINGVVYEGDFSYNSIEGQGKYFWTDGSEYEGEVKASLRYGKGKFVSPNQEAIYEGDWVDGLRQGQGKITFQSGAVYEGEFLNGFKHGQGTMIYPSGNYYEGQWEFDKKCGYGTMYWLSAKEKYYGNWSENMQNGFGVHIWLEQKGEGKLLRNRYEGEWQNGERHGTGTFYYANGSKYEGQWKNNLKEGKAIFTEDNGNVIQGEFKADRLVKEKPKIVQEEKEDNKSIDDSLSDIAGPDPKKVEIKKNEQITTNGKNSSQQSKTQKGNLKKGNNKDEIKNQVLHAPSLQTNSQQENQIARKKEIETNPFTFLIDINDLTQNVDDDVQRIQRDTHNMLLRHNSSIKQWYKHYCTKFENTIGEDAFAMDLQTFWKFMKDCKICDGDVTLAAINRLFYQGVKNNFQMQTKEGQLKNQIEILKRVDRNLTMEELKDLRILNLALTTSQNLKENQIDWKKLEILEKEEQNSDIYSDELVDIHNGSQVILFRHFVELIVRTSYIKYGKIQELHRSLEKFIENKLKPNFNTASVVRTNSAGSQKSSRAIDKSNYVQEFKDYLIQIYNNLAQKNKSEKYGIVDKTCQFKQLIQLLQDAEYITNEKSDKQKAVLVMEGFFDPESTLQQVDHMQKEEMANLKKKKPKKGGKDNQSQHSGMQPLPTVDYERVKAERYLKLYNAEMIFPDFGEFLLSFLFKFSKDLSTNKESELQKRLIEHLKKLINLSQRKCEIMQNKPKKGQRKWPKSQKDQEKDQLALQRIKEQKDAEEKRWKEAEKKREGRERARMMLEEMNIPSDNEDDSEDYN